MPERLVGILSRALMETLRPNTALTAPLLLILTFSLLSTLSLSFSFLPADNHLVACGSTVPSTVDNRQFLPDSPLLASATHVTSLSDPNPLPGSPQIYHSSRIFYKPTRYHFNVKNQGTHIVRFHFKPFKTPNLDLNEAGFHVIVNGYVVLSNFSVVGVEGVVVKEYFLWVDSDRVFITFVPVNKGMFGFVNAIEVISAPTDLIADVGMFVNGDKLEKFNGLTKQALETVYRVNVGGPKVTPFNDSVWRTWVPDDMFLKSGNDISRKVFFGGRIKYHDGGASREVGPDFVYGTARVISSTNASIPKVNMTWEFPMAEGFRYLVRLHFCDIASISLGLLYFNVYVNGHLAYENLDLSSITYMLASPFYADFVVDQTASSILSVSVGPSNMSMGYTVDGILNGVEIMKMNNSVGSLDGNLCVGMVLKNWPRGNIGVLFPLAAVVCLVLGISMLLHRRTVELRNQNTFPWSKLPTDIPELNLKHNIQQSSGKA